MRFHLLFFCIGQVFEGSLFIILMVMNVNPQNYIDYPKKSITINCISIALYTAFCGG